MTNDQEVALTKRITEFYLLINTVPQETLVDELKARIFSYIDEMLLAEYERGLDHARSIKDAP